MFFKSLFKKKHKVTSASVINSRDVTKGFENRNFNKQQYVIIGKKKMQYTQTLTIQRKGKTERVDIFVNHKIKVHKNKKTELILKPKKTGDYIRLW